MFAALSFVFIIAVLFKLVDNGMAKAERERIERGEVSRAK